MRNTKDSSSAKTEKPPVVGRGKGGPVKVVDVELKSKGKTKAEAALKAKKIAAKSKLLESKTTRQKAERVEKVKPHKVVKTEASQPVVTVPTEKLLRPFRKAAEQNRQAAKKLQRAKNQRGSFLAKPVKKGKRFLLDLRVHSLGTVGYFANGGIDPGPALIRLAQVKGLHMIGLTEYYNAMYLDRVKEAIKPDSGLMILPSVMLCCEVAGCREVPILALFPDTATSESVYRFLEELGVPKNAYGRKDFCLPVPFERVLEIIDQHGAVAIPSRVDKTPYRQLAIPELVNRYGLHAFDLAHPDSPDLFRERWPGGGFTFFSFSSANALGQIGNRVGKVCLAQLGFDAIKEIVRRRTPEQIREMQA